MNTQNVILDLSKKHMPNQIVRIGQGDLNGTTISASIMNNGVLEDLTGKTASFRIKNPAGGYYEDDECTISGSVISYTVNEAYAAIAAGYTDDAYFMVFSNGKKCSTSRFRVKVEVDAANDADPSKSYTSGIVEATQDANEAAQRANSLSDMADTKLGRAETAINAANGAADSANAAADRIGQPIPVSRVHEITGM